MRFGYTLLTEQSGPRDLVRHAGAAEDAGFDFEVMSDHYSPWLPEQGHAPYAWSVLGAVAQATRQVELSSRKPGSPTSRSSRSDTTSTRAGSSTSPAKSSYPAFAPADCDPQRILLAPPLMSGSQALIGRERLAAMKSGAWLVNTTRGPIVDRDALVDALERGHLGGCAGDTWYPQPAPSEHPWRSMPNHAMTIHCSGMTRVAQQRLRPSRTPNGPLRAGDSARSGPSCSWGSECARNPS